MKTLVVALSVNITIEVEEGVSLREVIYEMDYSFTSNTENCEIVYTEITDYTVVE